MKLKSFYAALKNELGKHDQGYVAAVSAICALPLLLLVALAVDYGNLLKAKNELKASIEATSLHIAKLSAQDRTLTRSELETIGKSIIQREIGSAIEFPIFDVDPTGVSVNISAKWHQPLIFPFAWKSSVNGALPIREAADVVFDLGDVDFYMLLDNSASMGFAATPAAVQEMYALTRSMRRRNRRTEVCAFACHRPSDPYADTLDDAEAAGIRLRIDAVRSAIALTLNEMEDRSTNNRQLRMSVHTFGTNAANRETHPIVRDLSDNYGNMRTALSDIKMIVNDGHNNNSVSGHFGQTNFPKHMTHMHDLIERDINAGNGAAESKVLFMVTDGVHITNVSATSSCRGGVRRWGGWKSCSMPMPKSYCDDIKDMGVKIAILYTEYLDSPRSFRWRVLVQRFAGNIEPALRQCASPGLFYKVEFGGNTIEEAMDELFDRALRSLQITG